MSYRAQKWGYGLRDLTGPEHAVLNCLCWHHNGTTGQCNPAARTIAAETSLAVGTVNKVLASLKAKGLIDEARDPDLGRVFTLAITEPAPLQESSRPAPTEQPYKNKNLEHKGTGARAPRDSEFWKKRDWRQPPAPPPVPAAMVFVVQGSPAWRAHEERQGRALSPLAWRNGEPGRYFATEWPMEVVR